MRQLNQAEVKNVAGGASRITSDILDAINAGTVVDNTPPGYRDLLDDIDASVKPVGSGATAVQR